MPNGVNIIETIPIMTNNFVFNLVWLIFALYFVYAIYEICNLFRTCFDKNTDCEDVDNFLIRFLKITMVTVCLFFILFAIACIYTPDYTGKNKYKVEITDFASFNEIYNNYEILEQNGNVYLIEEKELE